MRYSGALAQKDGYERRGKKKKTIIRIINLEIYFDKVKIEHLISDLIILNDLT